MSAVNEWTAKWAEQCKIAMHYTPNIHSTNTWAKESYNSPSDALYVSDFQSHGRGRNLNTWNTLKPGDALLSTWCFTKTNPLSAVFSMRVGIGLFDSLKKTWPQIAFSLKAPNDIYIGTDKLAGLLIEVVSQRDSKIYIGLGLNILDAPRSGSFTATHLSQHTLVDEVQWQKFCSLFYSSLKTVVASDLEQLTNSECTEIKNALNIYYKMKIEKITPDGSLYFNDGSQTLWTDL